MILGYHSAEQKFWVKNDLVWTGFPIGISEKCGISEIKRLFALAKMHIPLTISDPAINQAQFVDGSTRWISHMCHWMRPFLDGRCDYFENENFSRESGKSPIANFVFGLGGLRETPSIQRPDVFVA